MAPLIVNLGPIWRRETAYYYYYYYYYYFTLQTWANFKDNTVNIRINTYSNKLQAHSVALRPKAWVCGLWLPGIAGSNPAGCIDVCLLGMVCGFRQRSLRLADPSFRGFLSSVCVCVCVIECEQPQVSLFAYSDQVEEGRIVISRTNCKRKHTNER